MLRLPRTLLALLLMLLVVAPGIVGSDTARTGEGTQEPSAPPPPPPVAQEPSEAQQPVFRSGINFVRVDVIVTDKNGDPVTDLKMEDFDVFEDGDLQAVESFKLVRVTGAPPPGEGPAREIRSDYDQELEAQREDARIFVFFLDDYHVRLGASMALRESLARFVQNELGPLDLISVMYPLSPVSDVVLTRNRDAVANAIMHFTGRKYDYTPRNQIEEQYAMWPAMTVEQIRNQVSLSALRSLCMYLGTLREGRKHVVLVSEGYSNFLPATLRDPIASQPGYGNPNRRAQGVEESDAEQRDRFFADTDIQAELREVFKAANLTNTSIYALDPRGLTAFEFDVDEGIGFSTDQRYLQATMDTIRVLAAETDGRAIVNRNDLSNALKQMVRDSSAYYLIGYNSSAPSDGKFHELSVRLKRSGLQVRARKGFWALTTEIAEAALKPAPVFDPAVTEALATIAEPARGRSVRTWVGTDKGEGGRTKVTFVWEPLPSVPGQQREDVARVSLLAAGDSGGTYYRGRVPDLAMASLGTPDTLGPATRAAPGTPVRAVFEAPPGVMHLRVSMEGPSGEILDSETREVVVPDFTTPVIALGTPTLVRARTAVEARAFRADPGAVPTALREFRRTEQLFARVIAHGPGDIAPAMTARLLSRLGTSVRDLEVTPMTPGIFQVDLALASLAPGEYLIEFVARADANEARQLVAFRVTS